MMVLFPFQESWNLFRADYPVITRLLVVRGIAHSVYCEDLEASLTFQTAFLNCPTCLQSKLSALFSFGGIAFTPCIRINYIGRS